MIKLSRPDINYTEMVNSFESTMQINSERRTKLSNSKTELFSLEESYKTTLLSSFIAPISDCEDDSVVGDLTGKDLKWLYTSKLLQSDYYQKIRGLAKVCTSCLKPDKPKTLDHLLPKGVYFEYSVLPLNLIPMCRDCNSGEKGENSPDNLEQIPIHPYLDDSCFFDDQWVKVEFVDINDNQGIRYFVEPPASWTELNKRRAENFFNNMNLAEIFSVRAVPQRENMEIQIESMQNINLESEYIETLMLKGVSAENSISVNHWKVVLVKHLLAQ